MAHQYVYTMHRLGKAYGPGQEVLKDISLAFLPGAKIGVLGLNGAGKSTLLRIMAGEVDEFTGTAFVSEGVSVGYLPQEPRLNPDKTVKGNVEEGVAEHKGSAQAIRRGDRELQRGPDRRRAAGRDGRAGAPAGRDRGGRGVGPRLAGRAGDGRAAAAAAALGRHPPVGGRAAPGRAVPADAAGAGPAAPRRAHEPPRRRDGGLARAAPAAVQGHGGRDHPRPLLPRQRRGLDSRARPRGRHPVGGQLLLVARSEGAAARGRAEAGDAAPAHAGPRAGVDTDVAAGPAGEGQGASERLRGAAEPGRGRAHRVGPDLHSPRPPARGRGGRGPEPAQELRRHVPHPGPDVTHPAPGRHLSA